MRFNWAPIICVCVFLLISVCAERRSRSNLDLKSKDLKRILSHRDHSSSRKNFHRQRRSIYDYSFEEDKHGHRGTKEKYITRRNVDKIHTNHEKTNTFGEAGRRFTAKGMEVINYSISSKLIITDVKKRNFLSDLYLTNVNLRNSSLEKNAAKDLPSVLKKKSTKLTFERKASYPSRNNDSRGFDSEYRKQFVAPNGNMLPISHSFESVLKPPSTNNTVNPSPKLHTGWKPIQSKSSSTETSRQLVSKHFTPQNGWICDHVHDQTKFNLNLNYKPGLSHFSKKKKKFKSDVSTEDFNLEDLNSDDVNLNDYIKDIGPNYDERLDKLYKMKKIEKFPTRKLYSAKFPIITGDIPIEERLSKGVRHISESKPSPDVLSNNLKIFAGLENAKGDGLLSRSKRDLSPQGQAMATVINNFFLHERDCNETLDARRKKRQVDGLTIKKIPDKNKQNISAEPIIQDIKFNSVEAVVQGQLDISIYSGTPKITYNEDPSGKEPKGTSKENKDDDHFGLSNRVDVQNIIKISGSDAAPSFLRQEKQQAQMVTDGNYESDLQAKGGLKNYTAVVGYNQTGINSSNVVEKEKLSTSRADNHGRVSRKITILTRVNETINQFLNRQPTKLHPVKGSLESWRNSVLKSLSSPSRKDFANRSLFENTYGTTDTLLRHTRSLIEVDKKFAGHKLNASSSNIHIHERETDSVITQKKIQDEEVFGTSNSPSDFNSIDARISGGYNNKVNSSDEVWNNTPGWLPEEILTIMSQNYDIIKNLHPISESYTNKYNEDGKNNNIHIFRSNDSKKKKTEAKDFPTKQSVPKDDFISSELATTIKIFKNDTKNFPSHFEVDLEMTTKSLSVNITEEKQNSLVKTSHKSEQVFLNHNQDELTSTLPDDYGESHNGQRKPLGNAFEEALPKSLSFSASSAEQRTTDVPVLSEDKSTLSSKEDFNDEKNSELDTSSNGFSNLKSNTVPIQGKVVVHDVLYKEGNIRLAPQTYNLGLSTGSSWPKEGTRLIEAPRKTVRCPPGRRRMRGKCRLIWR